jgi:peptidylprolyl isomerase
MNLHKTLIAACLLGVGATVAAEPRVEMDIAIDGKPAGTIAAELYGSDVPITANNFADLCSNKHGYGYDGTPFHRIIPGFMMQGGDFECDNGTGGSLIPGSKKQGRDVGCRIGTGGYPAGGQPGDTFANEKEESDHSTAGLLSMANRGKDTNGSQFFITFAPTPWLNKNHVVFGKVTDGTDVMRQVEQVGRRDGEPQAPVELVDCRVLP